MNPVEKQFSVTRTASKARFPISRRIACGSPTGSSHDQDPFFLTLLLPVERSAGLP